MELTESVVLRHLCIETPVYRLLPFFHLLG